MVFTTGFIWDKYGGVTYNHRETGEGEIFRERKINRVSCEECGSTIAASSIYHHMEISHRVVMSQTQGLGIG